jgi:hypothetical protein
VDDCRKGNTFYSAWWRAVFDRDRAGDNNWKLAFPSAKVGYATIISYQAPQDMGLSTNRIRFVSRADGGITAFAIGKDIYKLELPADGR